MDPSRLTVEEQLRWLKEGADEVTPEADLAARLAEARETGRPLRVKLGLDPTAPDIHLGHTVVLRKLRQFQQLGHEVYLVIGDFTAMIGDPSGKSEVRRPLTPEEIRANARTYEEQVFRVLDPERTHIVFNNDWLGPMTFAEVVKLTSRFTVARLLERDDFARRLADGRPIAAHEFLYAFAQSCDSVHLQADVELGGTDQRFNILMGRDIQESYGQTPQVAVLMPILAGLDGVQKMSKSLGNYIGVTEPPGEMFAKLMSISDPLLAGYYELLTDVPRAEWEPAVTGEPMEAKKRLATLLTETYHGAGAGEAARGEWERIHSRRELPEEIPDALIPAEAFKEEGRIWIGRLLVAAGLAASTREARRLTEQGGVAIDGERHRDPDADVPFRDGMVIQIGRRRFARARRA